MPNPMETANQETKNGASRPILLSMAIIAAASTAFMFTLTGTMSWQECAAVVFAAGALTGGALFSVWTMQGLGE